MARGANLAQHWAPWWPVRAGGDCGLELWVWWCLTLCRLTPSVRCSLLPDQIARQYHQQTRRAADRQLMTRRSSCRQMRAGMTQPPPPTPALARSLTRLCVRVTLFVRRLRPPSCTSVSAGARAGSGVGVSETKDAAQWFDGTSNDTRKGIVEGNWAGGGSFHAFCGSCYFIVIYPHIDEIFQRPFEQLVLFRKSHGDPHGLSNRPSAECLRVHLRARPLCRLGCDGWTGAAAEPITAL